MAVAGKHTATRLQGHSASAGLVLAAVYVTAYRFCTAFIIITFLLHTLDDYVKAVWCGSARVWLLGGQQTWLVLCLFLFLR